MTYRAEQLEEGILKGQNILRRVVYYVMGGLSKAHHAVIASSKEDRKKMELEAVNNGLESAAVARGHFVRAEFLTMDIANAD